MNFLEELLENKEEILAEALAKQEEEEQMRQLIIEESISDVVEKVKEHTKKCFAAGGYKGNCIKINYKYVTYELKKWSVWDTSYEMRNMIKDRLKKQGFTHISMEVRSDLDAATVPVLWIKARFSLNKK